MDMDYLDGATPLDPDEMEGLRFKHISTRGELDQLEQAGITEGMKWLDKQKNPDVLTEGFVCDLHKRLFGDVWKWVKNDTYPPRELAARFHHKLVYIHPFQNGNGRHARIMADAVLIRLLDEPAIDWAGGYKLERMNERRDKYIAALRAADGHDYSELLKFVGARR